MEILPASHSAKRSANCFQPGVSSRLNSSRLVTFDEGLISKAAFAGLISMSGTERGEKAAVPWIKNRKQRMNEMSLKGDKLM